MCDPATTLSLCALHHQQAKRAEYVLMIGRLTIGRLTGRRRLVNTGIAFEGKDWPNVQRIAVSTAQSGVTLAS
jgi:hypothetical protein